jgi:hypothetical protein
MEAKPQQPGGPPIKFSMSDAKDILCKCGCDMFMPVFKWKKISRLLTGAAKDSQFPIEVFVCIKCGEVLEEVLPNEMKKSTINQ